MEQSHEKGPELCEAMLNLREQFRQRPAELARVDQSGVRGDAVVSERLLPSGLKVKTEGFATQGPYGSTKETLRAEVWHKARMQHAALQAEGTPSAQTVFLDLPRGHEESIKQIAATAATAESTRHAEIHSLRQALEGLQGSEAKAAAQSSMPQASEDVSLLQGDFRRLSERMEKLEKQCTSAREAGAETATVRLEELAETEVLRIGAAQSKLRPIGEGDPARSPRSSRSVHVNGSATSPLEDETVHVGGENHTTQAKHHFDELRAFMDAALERFREESVNRQRQLNLSVSGRLDALEAEQLRLAVKCMALEQPGIIGQRVAAVEAALDSLKSQENLEEGPSLASRRAISEDVRKSLALLVEKVHRTLALQSTFGTVETSGINAEPGAAHGVKDVNGAGNLPIPGSPGLKPWGPSSLATPKISACSVRPASPPRSPLSPKVFPCAESHALNIAPAMPAAVLPLPVAAASHMASQPFAAMSASQVAIAAPSSQRVHVPVLLPRVPGHPAPQYKGQPATSLACAPALGKDYSEEGPQPALTESKEIFMRCLEELRQENEALREGNEHVEAVGAVQQLAGTTSGQCVTERTAHRSASPLRQRATTPVLRLPGAATSPGRWTLVGGVQRGCDQARPPSPGAQAAIPVVLAPAASFPARMASQPEGAL